MDIERNDPAREGNDSVEAELSELLYQIGRLTEETIMALFEERYDSASRMAAEIQRVNKRAQELLRKAGGGMNAPIEYAGLLTLSPHAEARAKERGISRARIQRVIRKGQRHSQGERVIHFHPGLRMAVVVNWADMIVVTVRPLSDKQCHKLKQEQGQ